MAGRKWTPEEEAYLRRNYYDEELRVMMHHLGRTDKSIYVHAMLLGLKRNPKFFIPKKVPQGFIDSQFDKGHVPFNKGKSQEEYCSKEAIERIRKTQYKKGNIPHNSHELGEECQRSDGYIYKKVTDTGEPSKMMRLKHRQVWEQHHGPIPKGYNVQFRDGDRTNCDIDNLYLISRKDQLRQNQHNGRKRMGKKQREYEELLKAAMEPFRPRITMKDVLRREAELREASLDAWHCMCREQKPMQSERPRI